MPKFCGIFPKKKITPESACKTNRLVSIVGFSRIAGFEIGYRDIANVLYIPYGRTSRIFVLYQLQKVQGHDNLISYHI